MDQAVYEILTHIHRDIHSVFLVYNTAQGIYVVVIVTIEIKFEIKLSNSLGIKHIGVFPQTAYCSLEHPSPFIL